MASHPELSHSNVTARLTTLEERVDRLEQARAAPPATPRAPVRLDVVQSLAAELTGEDDGDGLVLYAGVAAGSAGTLAWQMNRQWIDVLDADPQGLAAILGALASPARVRLVQELMRGDRTIPQLSSALPEASTGQIYHHLAQLMAAGIAVQPRRGAYGMPPHHVVPVLATLAAALDLQPPGQRLGEPTGADEAHAGGEVFSR